MPRKRYDEDALTADIIELASQYDRYGYRRITALLRDAGWREREGGRTDLAAIRAEDPAEATEEKAPLVE